MEKQPDQQESPDRETRPGPSQEEMQSAPDGESGGGEAPAPSPAPPSVKNRPRRSARFWTLSIAAYAIVAAAMLFTIDRLLPSLFRAANPDYPFTGWYYSGDENEINQFRYRGRKIDSGPSDIVFLLVGDSHVQADACPFDSMPEQQLERHLRLLTGKSVKVFSLGVSGYGQDQQLAAIKRYFVDHGAAAVIHWFTDGNDWWNNMFPTNFPGVRDGQPKPTYILDRKGMLKGPFTSPADLGLYHFLRYKMFYTSLDAYWSDNFLPPPYRPAGFCSGEALTNWFPIKLVYENFENGKNHIAIECVPRSPRVEYALRLTNLLLREMQKTSIDNSAGFFSFFFVQPFWPMKTGEYELQTPSGPFYFNISGEQYWKNVSEMTAGVPMIGIPVMERESYHPDLHLNSTGVDRVMEVVAEEVATRFLGYHAPPDSAGQGN